MRVRMHLKTLGGRVSHQIGLRKFRSVPTSIRGAVRQNLWLYGSGVVCIGLAATLSVNTSAQLQQTSAPALEEDHTWRTSKDWAWWRHNDQESSVMAKRARNGFKELGVSKIRDISYMNPDGILREVSGSKKGVFLVVWDHGCFACKKAKPITHQLKYALQEDVEFYSVLEGTIKGVAGIYEPQYGTPRFYYLPAEPSSLSVPMSSSPSIPSSKSSSSCSESPCSSSASCSPSSSPCVMAMAPVSSSSSSHTSSASSRAASFADFYSYDRFCSTGSMAHPEGSALSLVDFVRRYESTLRTDDWLTIQEKVRSIDSVALNQLHQILEPGFNRVFSNANKHSNPCTQPCKDALVAMGLASYVPYRFDPYEVRDEYDQCCEDNPGAEEHLRRLLPRGFS